MTTRKNSLITRRRLLQMTAAGILGGVPAVSIVYRQLTEKMPTGPTEIILEGPFVKYGDFRMEDLKREDLKKTKSDFVLQYLKLDEGKYGDKIFITFTFSGEEDPKRKMRVLMTFYDKNGRGIGGGQGDFSDPRIKAREQNDPNNKNAFVIGMRPVMYPSSSLMGKIGSWQGAKIEDQKISVVSKIMIEAYDLFDI